MENEIKITLTQHSPMNDLLTSLIAAASTPLKPSFVIMSSVSLRGSKNGSRKQRKKWLEKTAKLFKRPIKEVKRMGGVPCRISGAYDVGWIGGTPWL